MTRAACSTLGNDSESRRTHMAGDAEELCNQSNHQRAVKAVHSRQACFLLVACLLTPFSVMAGSLSVTPIRVELSSAQRSVALTVRNEGDQPTVVQAQLVAWSQVDNEDRLEPTIDLLASPPIFTVAPGASHIVRIALRRAPDAALDRT